MQRTRWAQLLKRTESWERPDRTGFRRLRPQERLRESHPWSSLRSLVQVDLFEIVEFKTYLLEHLQPVRDGFPRNEDPWGQSSCEEIGAGEASFHIAPSQTDDEVRLCKGMLHHQVVA